MKKLIMALMVIVLMTSCNNDHTVTGNPEFESSFLYVTNNQFVEKIETIANEMNFPLTVNTSSKDLYTINEVYTIDYSEGFLIMSVNEAQDKESVTKMIELLVRTVEASGADINLMMQEVVKSETTETLFSGEYNIYSITNRYEFVITEDNHYEFHVEDARMGH
jgi:hypothetical protein